MARRPLNLTRDQLASFLKDPEQIKQFENLFASARNPQLAGGAAGSIPYQSGDTETTFLPIGTPGQVLQVNPTADAPEWGAYTGTGDVVRATGPSLSAPNLGTPASGTLTNCVGLPISTGVSGLGAGVATFLGTPSSANLATAVTDETGTGALVFGTDAALANPTITNGRAAGLDYVGFDNTPTLGTVTPGTVYWDDGNGTLSLNLKGGNVDCLIGEQEYARVYNDTASTLTKGQVVYISGAQGNRVAVKLAQADSDANSAHTIGFVAETIAAGGEGWVQISGPMYKLNTLGTTAGDTVYLSPTTPGLWTTTKPVAPNHLVILGFIERVHATVGSIFIKVDNGYELDELHNVKITSVANNDILQYDSAGPFWKNVSPSSISIGTATNLAGGSAGSVPYQTGAGATTFLSIGTNNFVLTSNGTAPVWTANTGTGNVVRATSPTLATPVLGTPTSGTLTNCTGLPISTGVSGLGANVATFLATPSSANLASAVTDETGSGALVFGTSPTLATPTITTSATVPQLIGGTGTTSTLALRSTSGVGTTGADIIFQTGNNGATEAMRILNSGNVGIGTNNPLIRLHVENAAGSYNSIADNSVGLYLKSNSAAAANNFQGIQFAALSGNSNNSAFTIGISSPATGYSPNLVFSQRTGASTFAERFKIDTSGNVVVTGIGGIGYGTGSGGAVTQATSRTTGVTLNKTNGAITLVSAAGTTAWQSFTVTNNTVAATDTVIVSQKSGTDFYMIHVTNVSAGSFQITFATTGGTTTEQPVFNFAVIKAVTS